MQTLDVIQCQRNLPPLLERNNVQPIVITYRTWPWSVIAIRSFQAHFPHSRLVVIDNNPPKGHDQWVSRCATEQLWLRRQRDLVVISNPGNDYSAGAGIDLAIAYCRDHHHQVMVHFEPDCLISGDNWLGSLVSALYDGAWMSGQLKRFYGPIHPTPSAWRTDVPWVSFKSCSRDSDRTNPRFSELFLETTLIKWAQVHEPEAEQWWANTWDTAQRNWFFAAALDKANQVEVTNDFDHFWFGSQRPPSLEEPRISHYLREVFH